MCSIGAARLYRLILFFSFFPFLFPPLSFFFLGCVHSGLLQVDYIFPPFFWVCSIGAYSFFSFSFSPLSFFFWVCSFGAATSIGLFSLQLILLFVYTLYCNIVSFHMTCSYRHMRIPAPTDRQLFTLDFLFGYSTFTHTIIT